MTPEPAYKARLRELFTDRTVAETENALIKKQALMIIDLELALIAKQEEIAALKSRGSCQHEGG